MKHIMFKTQPINLPGLLLSCLLLVTTGLLHAQNDVEIGSWREYYPYDRGQSVTQSEDQIFYASNVGLLALHKSDLSASYISKSNGLSDVEIRVLRYNQSADLLVLGYESGCVDLVGQDDIISLNNIKTANLGVGERNINAIDFEGEKFAFLSTNFGLVQIILENGIFGFTTFIDGGINSFEVFDNRYYVSTDEGIFVAPSTTSFNHADFSLWQKLELGGLPPTYVSVGIAAFNNRLYADVNGDLVDVSGDTTRIVKDAGIQDIKYLTAGTGHLVMGMECGGCDDDVFFMSPTEKFSFAGSDCVDDARWAIEDESGRIFFGDGKQGIRYSESIGSACIELNLNLPLASSSEPFFIPTDILFDGNKLYFASGGVSQNFGYTFNSSGLQIYESGQWSVVNYSNTSELDNPRMNDYYKLAKHPFDGRLFIGSFWNGLIEILTDGVVNIYDDENSCIRKFPDEGLRERISSVVFDDKNRLWLTNHSAPNELLLFDEDFVCHPFSTAPVRGLASLAIDESGQKWAISTDQNNGLVVFDEGILEDSSDDLMRFISSGNSALTTNRTNDLAIDLDGDVWVGTEEGVITFDCAASIFESSGCYGSQRKVDVDGNIALLLENENVSAIAVDGANRKWFGTRNGVFVLNSTGEELIHIFNSTNSPLPADDIRNIDINPNTGEVFITSTKGLVSYRTDATTGDPFFHDSEVLVFPNPVRPDYSGLIAIQGLPRDANVKITDLSGKLIFETTANGGEATWDGRDYNGNKASSGVYLVFSASGNTFNKPDALVSKIVFVR
jgi:hypothetical protein